MRRLRRRWLRLGLVCLLLPLATACGGVGARPAATRLAFGGIANTIRETTVTFGGLRALTIHATINMTERFQFEAGETCQNATVAAGVRGTCTLRIRLILMNTIAVVVAIRDENNDILENVFPDS